MRVQEVPKNHHSRQSKTTTDCIKYFSKLLNFSFLTPKLNGQRTWFYAWKISGPTYRVVNWFTLDFIWTCPGARKVLVRCKWATFQHTHQARHTLLFEVLPGWRSLQNCPMRVSRLKGGECEDVGQKEENLTVVSSLILVALARSRVATFASTWWWMTFSRRLTYWLGIKVTMGPLITLRS